MATRTPRGARRAPTAKPTTPAETTSAEATSAEATPTKSPRIPLGTAAEWIAYRTAGAIIWSIGLAATWSFIEILSPGAHPSWALTTQIALTFLESRLWKGRITWIALIALAFDVTINAGGLFPYAMKAAATPQYEMLVRMFGLTGEISPLATGILCLIIGLILAAAPEYLWRD